MIWVVLGLAVSLAEPPVEGLDPVTEEILAEEARIPGLPPGPPPPPDQVDDIAYAIGKGLRCPVCQGLSVADSSSKAAVMIQARIRELVAAGYTAEQINDYFVTKYSEWILLEPPPSGLNWLIWLAPGLAGGLGLAMAASVAAQWRKEPDPVPLPSDVGLEDMDPYEAALLAEIED